MNRIPLPLWMLPLCLIAAAPATRPANRLAPFGLSVTAPEGWNEIRRDKDKTVIQWASPDSTPTNIRGVITIEATKPTANSAEPFAEQLAKGWQGKVDSETTLDGEKAFHITADNNTDKLRPIEALVTLHANYFYLVMGVSTARHPCHKQIESIRASWHWTDIDSPSTHLEFLEHPLSVLSGTIAINVPQIMNTIPDVKQPNILKMSIPDLPRGDVDYILEAQLVTRAPNKSFDQTKNQLAQGIQTKFNLPKPLTWTIIKGDINRATLEKISVPLPKDKKFGLIYALVELDEKRFALLNFTFPEYLTPEEVKLYEATTIKIVDSVTPLPPAK